MAEFPAHTLTPAWRDGWCRHESRAENRHVFEHDDFNSRLRQQEAEHHSCGPSAHDAATSLQSARHRFSD